MLQQLLNHIGEHALCKTTDKILLAVSGGLDSMVMFHMMRRAGFSVAVAHCNFQLRGKEADADEAFVRAACARWGVPFFVKRFDTADYARTQGISTQMAARELRYDWFDELLRAQRGDLLATAHHFSDVTEGVFLNLIRGTGIDGFSGVAVRKGNIIRPMLFATRKMIAAYAAGENVEWREDASNASDEYQRNFVRHQLLPRMEELNPAFESGFRDTRDRLLGARDLMHAYLEIFRHKAVEVRDDGTVRIDMLQVRASPSPGVLLWELIKDMDFRYDQCRKIVEDHQAGKIFTSATHRLVVDRTHYIIEHREPSTFESLVIEKDQRQAGRPPFVLSLSEVGRDGFELVKDSSLAQLDADRLTFPLVWRRWEAGDYFAPLGMAQDKKVSDFLIDLKIPFNSKADVTVLVSGRDIVWIVGLRISDRYKVTDATKRILLIKQRDEKTVS